MVSGRVWHRRVQEDTREAKRRVCVFSFPVKRPLGAMITCTKVGTSIHVVRVLSSTSWERGDARSVEAALLGRAAKRI